MRLLTLSLLLMASMALVLLGCSDKSDPVVSPTDQTIASEDTPTSLAKSSCAMHEVTGSIFWRTIPLTGETNETNIFSAIQNSKGKLVGEIHLRDAGPQVVFDGIAIDLKVVGNKAKICYTITKGTWALGTPPMDIKGFFVCLVAIDHGSGWHGGKDEVSLCAVTDGSDIIPMTIKGITDMSPDEYVNWALEYFGVSHTQLFPPLDRGRVEVK